MNLTSSNALRVLMVEDSAEDALLVKRELETVGYRVTLGRVDSQAALVEALRREHWDIVFSDFSMPQFDGMEALKVVRDHDRDLPFIVVSGTIGEERAVMLMKQGAQDYVLKGNVKRLIPAVERELREAKLRREHRLAQEHIQRLAYFDSLTHLPNRQRLVEDLQRLSTQANAVSLVIVNLINFREINETLGYGKGDELIGAVAKRLRESSLQHAELYHLHGNEFAVLPQTDDRAQIETFVQSVLKVLAPHHDSAGFRIRIGARIGIALSPAKEASALLQQAGMAVTLARRDGKPFAWYEAARDPSNPQSLALLADLHDAIGTDQLFLVFQPKVQCGTGAIIGSEALLRWHHPKQGLIPPDVFIRMAEKSGLIDDIAGHVVNRVVAQIDTWRKRGFVLPVAINLSPKNLLNTQLMTDLLGAATQRNSGDPVMEIEITETALMHDPAQSVAVLGRLHHAGIRIYIDDFGTGFSSLGYLTQLPIHAIKIDKSFVSNLDRKPEADTIVRSTISLAHNLGLKVVAEGVETREVWDRLVSYRCDEGQGYYVAEPLSPGDFESLANKWRTKSR